METIGERIIRLREARGWNQTDLAKKAKVAQSTVAGVETGARIKAPSSLIEIAHVLGVDSYWLKTGKGSRLGGRQLSEDEEALLNALPLLDADVRESWIELAKKKVARLEAEKQKAA